MYFTAPIIEKTTRLISEIQLETGDIILTTRNHVLFYMRWYYNSPANHIGIIEMKDNVPYLHEIIPEGYQCIPLKEKFHDDYPRDILLLKRLKPIELVKINPNYFEYEKDIWAHIGIVKRSRRRIVCSELVRIMLSNLNLKLHYYVLPNDFYYLKGGLGEYYTLPFRVKVDI